MAYQITLLKATIEAKPKDNISFFTIGPTGNEKLDSGNTVTATGPLPKISGHEGSDPQSKVFEYSPPTVTKDVVITGNVIMEGKLQLDMAKPTAC